MSRSTSATGSLKCEREHVGRTSRTGLSESFALPKRSSNVLLAVGMHHEEQDRNMKLAEGDNSVRDDLRDYDCSDRWRAFGILSDHRNVAKTSAETTGGGSNS